MVCFVSPAYRDEQSCHWWHKTTYGNKRFLVCSQLVVCLQRLGEVALYLMSYEQRQQHTN